MDSLALHFASCQIKKIQDKWWKEANAKARQDCKKKKKEQKAKSSTGLDMDNVKGAFAVATVGAFVSL